MELQARTQIFRPYAVLLVCIALLLMLFLYAVVGSSNYSTALYRQQEILSGDTEKLIAQLNQIALIASQINSSSELLNMFIPLDDSDSGNYFHENLLDSIRAGSILETINSLTEIPSRICVFNGHGDMISAGRMYVEDQSVEETLSGELPGVLSTALSAHASVLVGPHADWWSESGAQVFSYIIPLSSVYNEKAYGFIAVEFQQSRLQQMDFSDASGGVFYVLTDETGADLLETGLNAIPEILENVVASSDALPHAHRKIDGTRYVFLANAVADTGRTLLRCVPVTNLIQPYMGGYVSILIGFLILIALLLMIAYRMADRVTRPLNEYAQAINGITLNNMTVPDFSANLKKNREMELLDQSFRRMLKKLNSSVELEIKAYLNALQSQTDPHFLYNMLTVIAEIADAEDEPDANAKIVDICQRLSKMLRYMADYDNRPVTLRDESTQLVNYLELMHVRYGERFTYEIQTEEEILNTIVPKMILQPIAENCFSHGFKQVRPPWKVRVEMHSIGRHWRVSVTDNGVGITDDEIRQIRQKIRAFSVDVAGSYQQMRIGGLGLVNTVLRMQLSQVQDVYFLIEHCSERGTRVTIGGRV